ncbi:MAG: alpha/beta fold hydrolase [Azonexus sp.]
MSYLAAVLLLPAMLWALNFGIKRGLTVTREVETSIPVDLPWREVRIPSANGKRLFGWFIPAQPGVPVLLVMHGWGGNAQMMLPLAAPLHAAGYALLFLDARCHGQSDDDSFASLPRFAEDIEHGLAWLCAQQETAGVAVGLIGHSVGAGAALLAASRNPSVALVVSLAAFAHPAAMMRRWLHFKHIPYWPLGAYVLAYVQKVIGVRFDDIAPLNTIRQVLCPVLLVHGLEDETVPASEAEAIHAQRSHDRVELLLIPGSHDEYAEMDRHLPALNDFLARALTP